jgi:hypothetical protein
MKKIAIRRTEITSFELAQTSDFLSTHFPWVNTHPREKMQKGIETSPQKRKQTVI